MKNLAAILFLAAGCTNQVTDGAFHVLGRVQGATTHVLAAAPGEKTVVANLDPQGNLDLTLAPNHAWAIGFADARQTGAAMMQGTLRSGTLDTLAPQGAGEIDLGNIEVAVGVATASVSRADLLAALGLDEADAARIGAADDLATRLVTPDADANGTLDAVEGSDFGLDLYGDLHLTVGERMASVTDLLATAAPVYGYAYTGTGIEVRMPATFQMSAMTGATMTFDAPFFGVTAGADAAMVPANTPIGKPALLTGSFEGHPIASVYALPGFDVPSGTYHFTARPASVTFQNIVAPTNEQLTEGLGLIVPFVRIVPTDARCVADCKIDSIQYRWMEHTETGWQDASPALLSLMTPARVDLVQMSPAGTSQDMHLPIPTTSVSGSIAWNGQVTSATLLPYELANVTTSQLCYVSAVYRDLVGTRLTSSATNPALACSGSH